MNTKQIRTILRGAIWLAFLALLVLQSSTLTQAAPEANRWSALGTGVNQYVNTLAIKGSDVYVGGGFTKAGGSKAKRMAEWNTLTAKWSACGSGLNDDAIIMVTKGKKIYVGGSFGGGLKTWHTTKEKWATVGGGVQGSVYALAFDGSDLYVGGDFGTVGGSVTAHNIAKYNLTTKTWAPLGGGLDQEVWVIAIKDHKVYAGGMFEHEEGNAATFARIAFWDGAQWNALGGGASAPVFAIALYGSGLVAGGAFDKVYDTEGGTPIQVNHIAGWNGSNWNSMGNGMGAGTDPIYGTYVWALTFVGDDLYVGGSFTTANSIPANHIAKTNVVTHVWSALAQGTNDIVWSIIYKPDDHNLYVGGEFTKAGGKNANHIAKWRVQ